MVPERSERGRRHYGADSETAFEPSAASFFFTAFARRSAPSPRTRAELGDGDRQGEDVIRRGCELSSPKSLKVVRRGHLTAPVPNFMSHSPGR